MEGKNKPSESMPKITFIWNKSYRSNQNSERQNFTNHKKIKVENHTILKMKCILQMTTHITDIHEKKRSLQHVIVARKGDLNSQMYG